MRSKMSSLPRHFSWIRYVFLIFCFLSSSVHDFIYFQYGSCSLTLQWLFWSLPIILMIREKYIYRDCSCNLFYRCTHNLRQAYFQIPLHLNICIRTSCEVYCNQHWFWAQHFYTMRAHSLNWYWRIIANKHLDLYINGTKVALDQNDVTTIMLCWVLKWFPRTTGGQWYYRRRHKCATLI